MPCNWIDTCWKIPNFVFFSFFYFFSIYFRHLKNRKSTFSRIANGAYECALSFFFCHWKMPHIVLYVEIRNVLKFAIQTILSILKFVTVFLLHALYRLYIIEATNTRRIFIWNLFYFGIFSSLLKILTYKFMHQIQVLKFGRSIGLVYNTGIINTSNWVILKFHFIFQNLFFSS